MRQYHSDVHDKIVEADRESLKRLGHGNAMAQAFNHTILPLDSEENARLQIAWGVEDFQYRFGRDPEGMWLPEAAISPTIIDMLSEAGIKFVVLSPWQCQAVEDEEGKMVELSGSAAPYFRPYILTGKKGKQIACFFYHPDLASSISFGHLLRSADNLYENLLAIKNVENPSLIHTATDGEIYGHHEPFGDMALAALIKKTNERDDFELTNYATYLENNPASLHAVLKAGEEERGTSWSCSHGVSRWYKDCGCHTGGEDNWNQKWRTPLRNALQNLSDATKKIFDDEVTSIFNGKLSSYVLMKKAGATFCGKISMSDFIQSLHKDYEFKEEKDFAVSELLYGMLNIHFSFTSCGFFFSDLSGIEPRQNIKYALYAIKMFQSYSDKDLLIPFLSDLKLAKSNLKSQGNGMDIAQQEMDNVPGEIEAALYFHMNRSVAKKDDLSNQYGRYVLESCKGDRDGLTFEADVKDTISLRKYHYTIVSNSSVDMLDGLNLFISESESQKNKLNSYRTDRSFVPSRMLEEQCALLEKTLFPMTIEEIKEISSALRVYTMLSQAFSDRPARTQIQENLGVSMKVLRSIFVFYRNDFDWPEKEDTITFILNFVKINGGTEMHRNILKLFSSHAEALAEETRTKGLTDNIADRILFLERISRQNGYESDITLLQNEVYPYYSKQKKLLISSEKAKQIYEQLNFS